MAEWGEYNPDNFPGFPPGDQAVNATTRHHFALALCGVAQDYAVLQQPAHFWAMTAPMRGAFARMPSRYPYYLNRAAAPAVPPLQTGTAKQGPSLAGPVATAQGPRITQERGVRQVATKNQAKNLTASDVVNYVSSTVPLKQESGVAVSANNPRRTIRSKNVTRGGERTSVLRGVSVSTDGTPEDVEALEEEAPSRASVARNARASTPRRTPASRKSILKRNARRSQRGSSVFSVTNPDNSAGNLRELQEKLQECKSWRLAFRMALCQKFTYKELKTCTATQADPDLIKSAADLAREYCRVHGQPTPTTADFHSAYFAARKSVKPYV